MTNNSRQVVASTTVWEVRQADPLDVHAALAEGWEPFAVTQDVGGLTYHLRRRRRP